MTYDKIIFGAGLYGLYAALKCAKKNEKILVLERDSAPFMRATYINQARVHMGYHYPRSYSTAIKSANYFTRFNEDYSFCVHSEFEQIYATGTQFSWTNASEFKRFCKSANIMCDEVPTSKYFNENMCDGAFLTKEYTYDAQILKEHLLKEIQQFPNLEIHCGEYAVDVKKQGETWIVKTNKNEIFQTPFILNATYAGVNNVHELMGYAPFEIKYELCEIILCTVDDKLKDIGFTVMDGPFFSIMPFGKTGLHSLTAVCHTPHKTSYFAQPTFACQNNSDNKCTNNSLFNCDECIAKPQTAWPQMSQLARKFLKEEYGFDFHSSLFSMKPILKSSEIDDSRPTVVRVFEQNPTFVSVLSGKINTVYDLDEVLF